MKETSKKTLIIGASENPERYSHKAAHALVKHNHPIFLLGNKAGNVASAPIHTSQIPIDGLDTVTLYINPTLQEKFYEYILSLKPKRVIFNPGTENAEFEKILAKNHIEPVEACTLVMHSIWVF